jgi:hypothetical protein
LSSTGRGIRLPGFSYRRAGNRHHVAVMFWIYVAVAVAGVVAYTMIGVTSG